MKQYYFNEKVVKLGDRVIWSHMAICVTEKLISDNPGLFKEVQSPIFVKIICEPKNAYWIRKDTIGKSYEVEKLSDRYCIKKGNGTIPMECCIEISAIEHLDHLLSIAKDRYPAGIRLSATKNKINHKTWITVEPNGSSYEYGIKQDEVWVNWCGTWTAFDDPIFFSEEDIPVYKGDDLWYVRVAPSNEQEVRFKIGAYDWIPDDTIIKFPSCSYKYFTDKAKACEFVNCSRTNIKAFDLNEIINDEELSDGEVIDSILNLIKKKQND